MYRANRLCNRIYEKNRDTVSGGYSYKDPGFIDDLTVAGLTENPRLGGTDGVAMP
jgi:hypothetical protein|tara:strand:- start:415 stop:579 length:165 start_codon:yes stop_codon:yes gene_type:complete